MPRDLGETQGRTLGEIPDEPWYIRGTKMLTGAPGGFYGEGVRWLAALGSSKLLPGTGTVSEEKEKIARTFDKLSPDPETRAKQIDEMQRQQFIGIGAGMTSPVNVPRYGRPFIPGEEGLIGPPRAGLMDSVATGLAKLRNFAARRGLKATPENVGMLREQFGDLNTAGQVAYEMQTPEGKPALPAFATPETRLSNVRATREMHGPVKSRLAKEADTANPEGIDLDALLSRMEAVAKEGDSPVERVIAGGENIAKIKALIDRFRAEKPPQEAVGVLTRDKDAVSAPDTVRIFEPPALTGKINKQDPATGRFVVGGEVPAQPHLQKSEVVQIPTEAPASVKLSPLRRFFGREGTIPAREQPTTRAGDPNRQTPVLSDKSKMSVTEANAFQEWLDNLTYTTGRKRQLTAEEISKDPELVMLRDLGHAFREAAKESLGKTLGPEKASEYNAALRGYGNAKNIERVVEEAANEADARRGRGIMSQYDVRHILLPGLGMWKGAETGGIPGLFAGLAAGVGSDILATQIGRYGAPAASRVLGSMANRAATSAARGPVMSPVQRSLYAQATNEPQTLEELTAELLRQRER